MSTYHQVVAINKETNEHEIMFGSFVKSDCKEEIECERDSWKADGYKGIKIISIEIADKPDPEVYDLKTSDEIYFEQAPNFNFELDKDELIERALEVGFISQPDPKVDLYLINEEY